MNMYGKNKSSGLKTAALTVLGFVLICIPAHAVNVISNGSFDSDISGWTESITRPDGTRLWDNTVYGASPGSIRYRTLSGSRVEYRLTDRTSTSQQINSTDSVTISFYWYKTATDLAADRADITVNLILPGGTSQTIWTNTQLPNGGQVIDGNYPTTDISNLCTSDGIYQIELDIWIRTARNSTGYVQANFDDIVLNVESGAVNNAPQVILGATQVVPDTVNRYGSNITVLSTDFTDSDQPGVGAFNVTYKIREPNDITELILVNNQPNGGGGLTITDNGGGSYTASYSYNPADAQTLGSYDLYFEVTDGTDNAIDDYADNLNELEIIEVLPNNAPAVASGATQVSVSPVNRFGNNTTVISATFTDSDQPGIGAFNVTFKILEPNNTTELILVNNQPNGGGGLTITDNGGGSYTAGYTYNPDDAQTLGLYDLYFEVTDGTDNAIDGYANNLDELEINEILANNAPQVTAGATQVSVSPVNRFGNNTTVISATFTDSDQPGIGAFNVTFKILEPNNTTELILVNNQPNGGGGLTITDNGGGSYTAGYTYNPDDAQTLGLYDLYFEVTDGTDNAIDGYANNLDELEIVEILSNSPPQVTPGATLVTISPVNRIGSNSTTIRTIFTDSDQPGVGAFNVTFKILEPNNTTELILVNNQPNGGGGLTITDNGGGSYTAGYTYNPDDAQTLGLYDLYFEVTDGTDNAIDGYANNLDELEIIEIAVNNPPQLAASITSVNPSSVNRFGSFTTQFSATFIDSDEPGVNAFYVTFKTRSPYNESVYIVADGWQNGQNGLAVTANGGGSYTASVNWDPPDNTALGYHDLLCYVSDGIDSTTDGFDNNLDELLIANGGENAPPIVPGDNTFASPAAVERIGANPTLISATFTDADQPGPAAFRVSFKLRLPDNTAELMLADSLANGQGGVTITDDGGGIYTASISWDPPDAQTLGSYDLYFQVSDGVDISYDSYSNNLDELEIYDAVTNNPPTIVADTTYALPDSLNRIGAGYTMIKSSFSDSDMPGRGAFTITIKVRDQSAVEYTIVDAGVHGQQGLRIVNRNGGNYEASVLWDPPNSQATGPYDLYFYVEDNRAGTAVDGYTANADELVITSSALLGDGYILRRTNDANNCGGPNSACHNIADHQSQNCLTCHTTHNTKNIYLVRDTIQTPVSGNLPVLFKTLGIGDPFNSPDPSAGDSTSGVMADDSDSVFTNICEVCHTSTDHHRNDGSQPDTTAHHNAEDCTSCHPHTAGFSVSGGGESEGGQACSCHNSIFNPMNTSTTSYHHQMNGNSADYTISSRTCLTCHVDHDIFRPDLNSGFGQRAKNLRVDITTPVVQGSSAVLANSDNSSTGTGGICLSCHTSVQTKGYTQPDSTVQTPAISKASYDAATTAHNYNVSSTFSTDASTFNANCVKCHNDNMTKSYQNSTAKFGTHNSDYRRILAELGIVSPADPLEQKFCFKCHSTTSNPNAGSNLDYYGVRSMTASALAIEGEFGYTYTHPTTSVSGAHQPIEDGTDLADGNRHAECVDCHNPHAAQQGTHDGSSNLVSNALKGTWGVEPDSFPDPAAPANNANVFTAPAVYNRVEPAQKEYQICLKCHSNYTTLPSGARNLAEEINPKYESMHGIVSPGTNTFCNSTTMNEPWGSSGVTYCSDCHRSSNSADPEGPHGSNMEHLLVATAVSNDVDGTPLCNVCHKSTVYWDGSASASRYPDHPGTQSAHRLAKGCFSCHMWDYASFPGLGVQTVDDLAAGQIFVHGQNKVWNFYEVDGTPGTGNRVDAFVNGYIANHDVVNKRCWAETCKNHANKAY